MDCELLIYDDIDVEDELFSASGEYIGIVKEICESGMVVQVPSPMGENFSVSRWVPRGSNEVAIHAEC